MFNETEWNDNIHAFPRATPREIARNQREANDETERSFGSFGVIGALVILWAFAALGAYFLF